MENEGQTAVCTLCLKSCECTLENVEAVNIEMLGVLGLELNSNVSGKPTICKTCSENLQKCFNFKTVCLCTEDYINSFRDNRDNLNLDLNEIYLRRNDNENVTLSKCYAICRLCMGIIESGCCVSLNEETSHILSVKAILGRCISELDLEITKNPVICTSCNKSLHCYFSFIETCLDMNDKVKKQCKKESSNDEPQVESDNVLPFGVENTLKYANSSSSLGKRKDCSEYALYDGIKLKSENLLHEPQELCVKHEVDEYHEVGDVKAERLSDIVENYHGGEQNSVIDVKYESSMEKEDHGFNIKYEAIDIKMDDEDTARIRNRSLELQTMIPRNASEGTVYSCATCTYKTIYKSNFKQHTLIHKDASEIAMYSCRTCTYQAKRKDEVQRHMLIHKSAHEVTMYSCTICPYKTKRKADLRQHMYVHKNASDDKLFSCGICTFKTKQKRYLRTHMLIHRNASEVTMYSCVICSYKTKRICNLQQHMPIHKNSSDVTMYSCEICTFKSKRKSSLRRHMLIHKNTSETATYYSCEICTYKAKRKGFFQRHLLMHKNVSEVRMYSCDICTFKTQRKNTLQRHTLIHKDSSEVTMYSCEMCTYKTIRKGCLKRHIMLIHKIGFEIHQNDSEITMYLCDTCTYKTKAKNNLNRHMLVHKNPPEVTVYQCDICAFKTRHKHSLERHIVSHKSSCERKV